MPIPETAVDEDDLAPAAKDQVGRAGQVAAMQAEAVAEGVDETADDELGAGVLAADAGRAFAALAETESIHQADGGANSDRTFSKMPVKRSVRCRFWGGGKAAARATNSSRRASNHAFSI